MTLDQIKAAVDNGKTVHWANSLYRVVKDKNGDYLILCTHNQNCIGLTHKDGVTMNGNETEFFVS